VGSLSSDRALAKDGSRGSTADGGDARRSAVRKRFLELGLDVATPEQQTSQGLGRFQEAEIKKWWPIIRPPTSRASERRRTTA